MKYEVVLIDGWFTYPYIHLWCKSMDGDNHFFKTKFVPTLLVRTLSMKGHHQLLNWIQRGVYKFQKAVTKRQVWRNYESTFQELLILKPKESQKILAEADALFYDLRFYSCDLPAVYLYFLQHFLYPFSRVEIQTKDGWIKSIQPLSPAVPTVPEPMPPMRKISLRTQHGKFIPLGKRNPLVLGIYRENNTPQEMIVEGNPSKVLNYLARTLIAEDPDIIFTYHGDEFIVPEILRWQEETKILLPLDRPPYTYRRKPNIRKSSFFSYGRVIYKPTAFPFYGRLHIDRGVSFFYSESHLEGILEMAMFSRLPIQKLARSSPGSAMSAMEDEVALSRNYAIPREKGKASKIRSLADVLKTDQGGITYRPPVGIFTNVWEYDFRSLYPSIMVQHNISGETTNCKCCQDGKGEKVPFTPYYTCTQRRGIVSETLKALLDRRTSLKNMLSTNLPDQLLKSLSLRDTAIKWCLVTAFGYTGYKNAKYGQREAHESITAWGRESLLTAKEIAESMGYEFLHALTDSLWVRESQGSIIPEDFVDRVKDKTGLQLIPEAYYSWVLFPDSQTVPGVAPANRYLARSEEGNIKVRGFLSRRKDTPIFIKLFQKEIFTHLSKIETVSEIRKQQILFRSILKRHRDRLIQKKFEPEELVFSRIISRPLEEYSDSVNSASKIVLEKLSNEGQNPIGGEKISYIVSNRKARRPKDRYMNFPSSEKLIFDIPYYIDLLEYSYREILGWISP
jgi:DNA polymerase-2